MGIGVEILLEPVTGLEIEVVGRFVEQQQVGLIEQQLGEGDAHLPAAGKRFGRALEVGRLEAEALENGPGLQLDAVAVVHAEAILQIAVAVQHLVVVGFGDRRIAQSILEGVHLGFDREQRLERARCFFEQGPPGVRQAVLGQVSDRQCGRLEDGARVRLVHAGHHLQQRGLAGTVRTAQPDPFAISDLPGDVVEQNAVAEGFGEL